MTDPWRDEARRHRRGVDPAHAARAEFAVDAIRAEAFTDCRFSSGKERSIGARSAQWKPLGAVRAGRAPERPEVRGPRAHDLDGDSLDAPTRAVAAHVEGRLPGALRANHAAVVRPAAPPVPAIPHLKPRARPAPTSRARHRPTVVSPHAGSPCAATRSASGLRPSQRREAATPPPPSSETR